MRHIEHLLGFDREALRRIAKNADRYYRPFSVPKANGGQREIDNPLEPLKSVQRAILQHILYSAKLPTTMLGCVPGASVRQNALIHAGQPVVVTLDIRSCFPSISHRRVFRMFRAVFGASDDVASLLTRLTTWRHRLPQGAPSSPMLCNLALLPLHLQLSRLAGARNLRFSQWVDDIALSGPSAHKVVGDATQIIRHHGFREAPGKTTTHLHWEVPQIVTGAVVNYAPAATRRYREELRLFMLSLRHDQAGFVESSATIRGRIAHVAALRPSQGGALLRLLLCLQQSSLIDEDASPEAGADSPSAITSFDT